MIDHDVCVQASVLVSTSALTFGIILGVLGGWALCALSGWIERGGG